MKENNKIKRFSKKKDYITKTDKVQKLNAYSIFCNIIHGMTLVVWTYSITLVIIAYVIPTFSAYLLTSMGLTYESEILDILGLWMLPCIFVVLLLFALTIFLIKGLHKWLKKNFDKSIQKHKLQKQTEEKVN